MSQTVILILAAGSSTRMAPNDKLTEMVDGQPLLRRQTLRALDTGARILVVLPPDRPARNAALDGLPVQIVTAPDAQTGMTASLRAGIKALPPNTPGAMILPADMPGLTTADMALLLDRFAETPTRILRGTSADGREGHPALFPADLFSVLMTLQGDEGGRAVLQANRDRIDLIALPGTHAILDLDTPDDWAAFRASGGQ